MDPTASIRKLGFRRWYERQLIDSHLALVTCFLCGIVLAACIEVVSFRNFGWDSASKLGVVVAAIVVGWLSWRRYITVLERAERYGQRSICPDCHTYARFDILATGLDEQPGEVAVAVAPLEAAWLRVKCRKCGAAWRMPE
jgi:hypothetical protein